MLRLLCRLSGFTLLLLSDGRMPLAAATAPTECVPLEGLESGGSPADGKLDLDVIKVSLKDEAFNPFTSLIPIVAGCSAGVETPIAMRNLLGETHAIHTSTSTSMMRNLIR